MYTTIKQVKAKRDYRTSNKLLHRFNKLDYLAKRRWLLLFAVLAQCLGLAIIGVGTWVTVMDDSGEEISQRANYTALEKTVICAWKTSSKPPNLDERPGDAETGSNQQATNSITIESEGHRTKKL